MNKDIEELPQMQETLEDLVKTLNTNDSWDLYCIGIKLREKSIWLEELTKKTNECWELQEELKQLKKQKDDVVKAIKGILEINNNYSIEKLAPFYSRKWLEDTHTDLLRMLGEIE